MKKLTASSSVLSLSLAAVLASCGETETPAEVAARNPPTATTLSVSSATVKYADGKLVTALRGRSDGGATVSVGAKKTVADSSGAWAIRAGYDRERDSITVRATSSTGRQPSQVAVPQPKRPHVTLTRNGSRDTTTVDAVKISGTVKVSRGSVRGIRVTVNGSPIAVSGGRWSDTVNVSGPGFRNFVVRASRPGADGDSLEISMERRLSPAERVAKRAREEAAREAKAAARKSAYIDAATFLRYAELSKNPDRFAGRRVQYSGKVLQAQESGGSTILLVEVTDEGYGIYDDIVYVNYRGITSAVEDDLVTITGTIDGSKSYDTPIGGTNDVPEMTARYIENNGQYVDPYE